MNLQRISTTAGTHFLYGVHLSGAYPARQMEQMTMVSKEEIHKA
jgi:hypothetical protein